MCTTIRFCLKWCVKIKTQQKNKRSQPKKIIYEIVNFGSTEWYNIFIISL